MHNECFYNLMKRAALIVPIYGFMFFFELLHLNLKFIII